MDSGNYFYDYGTTDGNYGYYMNTMGGKSYCTQMYEVISTIYTAICSDSLITSSWYTNSCPKGWGRNKDRYANADYTAYRAQGYIRPGTSVPVYGYVTRYRSACYNYIAGRVSKA